MNIQLNKYTKEQVITKHTTGAVTIKSVAYDLTNKKRRTIEEYTLIAVKDFNFATRKVIVSCMKNLETYDAEVDIHFLTDHCALTTPDLNQDVQAIMLQNTVHNLLDKDTAIFIIVMTLTYISGLLLGRIF